MLQSSRKVREPAPRYDYKQPSIKVRDQITVNSAKAIFPPTHPPSSYNKNMLESPVKIVEAPMHAATMESVDRAFNAYFNVEDAKDDELHIPAGLLGRIRALTKNGYSQEFVDSFIQNLGYKSMSKLTPQQQSIYAQLVGHHTTPEKEVQLTSEELKLIYDYAKIKSIADVNAVLTKVKSHVKQHGHNAAMLAVRKAYEQEVEKKRKAAQSGTPSTPSRTPGTPSSSLGLTPSRTPQQPGTPQPDPLEVLLVKLGMDPATDFKDDAYMPGYFPSGTSKAKQLEPYKYLFAKGRVSGNIPDRIKWNGDSTKFIKNNSNKLITVGQAMKALKNGNLKMDTVQMKLVPIR